LFKTKIFMTMMAITLIIVTFALSCAPAAAPAKPATPAAPVTPAAPSTPPAAPATPAEKPKAPEISSVPPIPKQLQGEDAVRFVDTASGFSIWYPKSWPDYGPGIIGKARKAEPGYDSFSVVTESKQGTDLLAQLKNDYMNNPAMKSYGVEVKPISSRPIKLVDGTVATEVITNCVLASGLYNVYLYAIVADKGDGYIIATGNTLRGESAQQGLKEIVQTFSLNTK
jgi:hypothetical protein